MLALSDSRWRQLSGGYRVPYDASEPLRRLAADFTDLAAWKELWNGLHHQGDVDEASYAALPVLVQLGAKSRARDWQLYGLANVIETERHSSLNPPVPSWLADDYKAAWTKLVQLALEDLARARDREVVQSALATVALGRGARDLGAFISWLDNSELMEILNDRLRWSELYQNPREPHL